MNEKQFDQWSRIRGQGKSRYILKYGVLFWGTVSGILTGLIFQLLNHGFSFSFISSSLFWFDMIARIIFFQICGIFFGLLTWNASDKRWMKELQRRNCNIP